MDPVDIPPREWCGMRKMWDPSHTKLFGLISVMFGHQCDEGREPHTD